MVMRWEDGAPSPVIRWEDMQPDKVYWEDTEIWTPPSSGPDGALTRTFVITAGALTGSPVTYGWSRGEAQSGTMAGGSITPEPINLGVISPNAAGNFIVFATVSGVFAAIDPATITVSAVVNGGVSTALRAVDRVPRRWVTGNGAFLARPADGDTITVTLTASDARVVAIA